MSLLLKPTPQLLLKLGSIVVHADELISDNGHPLDKEAIRGLLEDPEVKTWLSDMQEMAMLPLKRK